MGSYFLHTIHLNHYKKEYREYIFKNNQQAALTTLTISPSELYTNSASVSWEDGNKEVVYKGVLYDVINIKSKGRIVELTAISDTQETALNDQFSVIFDTSICNDTNKSPLRILKSFFALKYIVSDSLIDFIGFEGDTNLCYNPSSVKITNHFISKESPPPEVLCN